MVRRRVVGGDGGLTGVKRDKYREVRVVARITGPRGGGGGEALRGELRLSISWNPSKVLRREAPRKWGAPSGRYPGDGGSNREVSIPKARAMLAVTTSFQRIA